jgi:hypothetical protein
VKVAALAGTTLTAHRPPVQHDEVAGFEPRDAGADGFDHPRRLVAEQEREVVVDPALAVVQIGVADPARLHLHHRLTRPRVGHVDRRQFHRRALAARDDGLHLLRV